MDKEIELLLNHTSVRRYQDKPVPREIVNTIVQCAQMAPTSSYFQAYSIIEVQDKNKRVILAEAAGGQVWVNKAPLVLLFCGDLNRGRKYYEEVDQEIFSNTESYTVATIDAALAAQKALIAAQTLGLGGVFVGGIRNDVDRLIKEFKLPDLVFPLFALCLGYPNEMTELKPRLPQEAVHKIDFYDESKDDELIEQYNKTISEYYMERSRGRIKDRWTSRCGKTLMDKPRDEVGYFFRKIGLLKK